MPFIPLVQLALFVIAVVQLVQQHWFTAGCLLAALIGLGFLADHHRSSNRDDDKERDTDDLD